MKERQQQQERDKASSRPETDKTSAVGAGELPYQTIIRHAQESSIRTATERDEWLKKELTFAPKPVGKKFNFKTPWQQARMGESMVGGFFVTLSFENLPATLENCEYLSQSLLWDVCGRDCWSAPPDKHGLALLMEKYLYEKPAWCSP